MRARIKEIYDLKHDLVASRLKYEETEKKNRNLKQEIDSLQKIGAAGGRAASVPMRPACRRTEEITCEITGKKGPEGLFFVT